MHLSIGLYMSSEQVSKEAIKTLGRRNNVKKFWKCVHVVNSGNGISMSIYVDTLK